jgi:NADH:ubiquinone oxidoreductase subunit 6 (subunit J)
MGMQKTAPAQLEDPQASHHAATLGMGFSGAPVGPQIAQGLTNRAHYLLPFEIVSIHLLVVLIGAAYLARAKKRKEAAK